MLLALPSGVGPGTYALTIIWKVNQPQLKEILETSGGTLGFHETLVENGRSKLHFLGHVEYFDPSRSNTDNSEITGRCRAESSLERQESMCIFYCSGDLIHYPVHS